MIGDPSLLAAALTVTSVVSLSVLTLLCLRCKKKSTTIHEEAQIYDPQIFHRGGSKFAVMRSKTVTRGNQMSSPSTETCMDPSFQEDQTEEQDYENTEAHSVPSSLEHDYVLVSAFSHQGEMNDRKAPIAVSLYENEKTRLPENDEIPGVYGNVFPSLSITEDDDYENSEFLERQDSDEPDYVNENGECT